MSAVSIVIDSQAIQYDGTNRAAIEALIPEGYTFTSESGGVWEFNSNGTDRTVNTDDWVIFGQEFVTQVNTDEVYQLRWRDDPAGVSPVQTGHGADAVPALALGASTTIQVALRPAQADTAFTADAVLYGATANLTITGVSIVNTGRVDVTVQVGALATYVAGAFVDVVASR